MKKFKVNFFYEETGSTIVDAESEDKACEKVNRYLRDEGLTDLCINIVDRNYAAINADEIKEKEPNDERVD